MREEEQNRKFIVVSDEPREVAKKILEYPDTVVLSGNELYDLGVMSACQGGGILSPSSFSWWGASLGRWIGKNDGRYIAPEFWFGWRLKEWDPYIGIKTKWIEYQRVKA